MDVKKKSRYRVKESPHVPELELAKKSRESQASFLFLLKECE